MNLALNIREFSQGPQNAYTWTPNLLFDDARAAANRIDVEVGALRKLSSVRMLQTVVFCGEAKATAPANSVQAFISSLGRFWRKYTRLLPTG